MLMVALTNLVQCGGCFEVNRLDINILLLFSKVYFDVYNPKIYWVFQGYNKMQAVDFGECRRGHSPMNKNQRNKKLSSVSNSVWL